MLDTTQFIGKIFGKLKIISLHHKKQKYSKSGCKDGFLYYFECICECGNKTIVNLHDLTSKHTLSCGCFQKSQTSKSNKKHGLKDTRLFNIWVSMRQRCFNKNNQAYKNYGNRGIIVCNEWKDDFKAFYDWSMANGYKEDLTIDRIDVNGNYEPSNCRWATYKQQNKNYRRNVFVEYNGEKYCLKDLAEKLNINYNTLHKSYTKTKNIIESINKIKKRG